MSHKVVNAVKEREARSRRAEIVALAKPKKAKTVAVAVVAKPKSKKKADVEPETLVEEIAEGPEEIEVYAG